jgi:hypothetical protein
VFVIPVERASANAFFFDGLDSGADTETVTISGKFISDENGHKMDTYFLMNRNDSEITSDSYNIAPPLVCLVTDTFWLFTSRNGGSVEYNTKETWNELFSKRFPDLFRSLITAYSSRYNV